MAKVAQEPLPLEKIRSAKYLLIEALMYVDYDDALNFMHKIDKGGRDFLTQNFISIKNSFENEGLITYDIETNSFRSF